MSAMTRCPGQGVTPSAEPCMAELPKGGCNGPAILPLPGETAQTEPTHPRNTITITRHNKVRAISPRRRQHPCTCRTMQHPLHAMDRGAGAYLLKKMQAIRRQHVTKHQHMTGTRDLTPMMRRVRRPTIWRTPTPSSESSPKCNGRGCWWRSPSSSAAPCRTGRGRDRPSSPWDAIEGNPSMGVQRQCAIRSEQPSSRKNCFMKTSIQQ